MDKESTHADSFRNTTVYTVHKYVKISWTSERLGGQSALALSILEIGSESRNDANSLMVLAVLIKSFSGVDVSWRAWRFSS